MPAISPRARAKPLFTASTTPLSGSDTHCNSGALENSRRIDTVSSVEAPSMTISSSGRES